MTFNLDYLFAVVIIYLALLFLLAYAADNHWLSQRIIKHPATYALSLGVYATTWSYYGSVGFAEQLGFLFLTIYLGATLAFLLGPILLAPILRLMRDYQLTSLADLFAFRYSSQLAGILVTVFMLVGILPYIALQIQAVTESIRVLTQDDAPLEIGLIFCVTLILFAILFGARHVSPRDKHAGLVVAIAFESFIKLIAILAVAGFAVFGVFDGLQGLDLWLQEHPAALQALYKPVGESPWLTLLILSFAAVFLLPRQFHMLFVENLDAKSLPVAYWLFPLFLLLFNIAIPPILWAGQSLATNTAADYYTLGITLFSNSYLLPTLAFIGGISAASAMVIVTTLALSQMALNHLLLPASYPDPDLDMYGWLLWGRRMLITAIIMISYLMYVVLEHNTGLVQLGLISFVAVAQFLPGIAGLLLWRRATRAGFLAGLIAGALIWYLSLIDPLLANAGLFSHAFDLKQWLGPATIEQNIWAYATFWSLTTNGIIFFIISLLSQQDSAEQRAVAACFQTDTFVFDSHSTAAVSAQQLSNQLQRIIGTPTGHNEVEKALLDLGLDKNEQRPHELRRLRDQVERNLSGMLGPMLARMIVESPLPVAENTRSMLADHIRFVEHRLEQSRNRLDGLTTELDSLRRYHQQILQDLPLGACSLSVNGEIVNWNQAMERLSSIQHAAAIGLTVQQLPPPWATLLGNFLHDEQEHIPKTRLDIRGRPRWFNLHKAAIATANQKIPLTTQSNDWAGVVILVEDVTDVQTLEAELAHSERLASIGRLAAGIAHEIGNPVTGIACIAQNLLEEENLPQLIEENAKDILQQTERIDAIVRSLLTFSHSGTVNESAFELFSLHICINEALRLVKLSHHDKQLHYINHCPSNLNLQADQQRLQQVFVNLLSNASDASPIGGHIEISAELTANDVIITVSDQGTGIPEALQERIFEPFFTTKQPGAGTGLGLQLVYNIIQDHSGTISVSNKPQGGAQISLRLPREQSLTSA